MKVITEAVLRQALRASGPETYYIPDGKILSPAAREYLQQRKIKIAKETQSADQDNLIGTLCFVPKGKNKT